jgi:hypothetical protein
MVHFMPRSDIRGRALPPRNREAVWRSPQYDQEDAEFFRAARLAPARTSKKLGPYKARIDAILAGDSRVRKIEFSGGHGMRKVYRRKPAAKAAR